MEKWRIKNMGIVFWLIYIAICFVLAGLMAKIADGFMVLMVFFTSLFFTPIAGVVILLIRWLGYLSEENKQ